MVKRDCPDLAEVERPVVLLVFAKEPEYRSFWPKLAEKFNSVATEPQNQGYTIFGIAGSSFDREVTVRPVYIQEACHALLAQLFGVTNQSEWLHEGVANYYQLHWSKQNINQLMRQQVLNQQLVPLEKLLNGQRLSGREYGQAVLFAKWLLEDPTRRKQLQEAVKEMRERSSTNMKPLAEKHFGMSFAEMESAWLDWAKEEVSEK
jgi:hypothetical protein